MTVAKVLRWISVLPGVIVTFFGLYDALGYNDTKYVSLVIGIALVVCGWISSLFLYGFGIIVAAHEAKLTAPAVTSAPAAPAAKDGIPATKGSANIHVPAPATKPNTAYNQEELEILRTLRQDGAISDEEYQQLIEKQADT